MSIDPRLGGDLLVRNVCIGTDAPCDVRIANGRIVEIAAGLRGTAPVLDGRGGALLPGLHDHHIHLLALAAQLRSVPVGPNQVSSAARFTARLQEACANAAAGAWVRATGYDDSIAGPLDRHLLDRCAPDSPVRVQYRTGTLWVLNSAALARVLPEGDLPPWVELDGAGVPTGRIWHADPWLRSRIGQELPALAPVGALLAQAGVTGVTDTSVSTGAAEAAILAAANRSGALPQRLCLMSGGELAASGDRAYMVGPVKLHLHEAQLPGLEQVVATIQQARRWSRCVAFHCVTLTELAFALAALDEAGVAQGDRIEHGAVIDAAAARELAARGLTVVTQPSFVAERGDRYLREVPAEDLNCLYPCASLLRAGVAVAGSTDAPYAKPDPWAAMAAAQQRRTRLGRFLGDHEAVGASTALTMFLGSLDHPGGPPRQIGVGAEADLCLLHVPLEQALRKPAARHVRATVIAGRVVHDADAPHHPPNEAITGAEHA